MTKKLFSLLFVTLLSSTAVAQHSDVEFGYDDHTAPTQIVLEQDELTSEGFQFFEAEFEEDAFDPGFFEADEPGFATVDETATGGPLLRFNPGDQVFLTVLDASTESDFGVGYVNFYNPEDDVLEASGRISVGEDNTSATDNAIFDGLIQESGDNAQLIGIGDSDAQDLGGIHDHLVFDILDDATAPAGAYGLLVRVDAVSATFGTVESDKFWLIFNHQLDEEVFETRALGAFGVAAVPEPASGTLLFGVAGAIILRRRKKLS